MQPLYGSAGGGAYGAVLAAKGVVVEKGRCLPLPQPLLPVPADLGDEGPVVALAVAENEAVQCLPIGRLIQPAGAEISV